MARKTHSFSILWATKLLSYNGEQKLSKPIIHSGMQGEYYDQETGLIYLRNRYYDNSIGRFITEDPIKDGLNWYVYCENNPVMFVDPWGLKKIVVSGGNDGEENFKYNFIETAIKCIADWKKHFPNEKITWVVANWNYSSQDLENFKTVADSYKVDFLIINNKQELFDYINVQGMADPISEMAFFAHGTAFDNVAFVNEGHKNDYAVALGLAKKSNNDLNIFGSDIEQINSNAFTAGGLTYFGSCRTGAEFSGVIFAQTWANKTRHNVSAAVHRTTYYNIYPDNRNVWDKFVGKVSFGVWGKKASRETDRAKYGFCVSGSLNYPNVVSGGEWKMFTPN